MIYAASFSAVANSSNKTVTETITLDDTAYTHAFIFINTGTDKVYTTASGSSIVDHARSVYLVSNDNTEVLLYGVRTSSGDKGQLTVKMSNNIITIKSIYNGTSFEYAYATGSGVILAYK